MVLHGTAPPWPTWAKGKDWRDLHNFMMAKKAETPYPTYLYRYIIPRHDSPARPITDFGSDLYESLPIPMPVGRAQTDGTVGAFLYELSRQLAKYQNQLQLRATRQNPDEDEDEERPKLKAKGKNSSRVEENRPSPIVSLSGDFRWTVQKACKIMCASSDTIVPGVGVFDTALAKDIDCVLYRVSDLLEFFDAKYPSSKPRPATFPDEIRYWARNADEYIVWSHVPRSALVSYVPCTKLAPYDERNFLTMKFRRSKDLAAVRNTRWVRSNPKKYWNHATDFVSLFVLGMRHELLIHEPARLRIDVLMDAVICPRQWGFLVLPASGKLPKNYIPSTKRILDFTDSANLSDAWKAQMRAVAEQVCGSALEAIAEFQATQGKHAKKCVKCKCEPWL